MKRITPSAIRPPCRVAKSLSTALAQYRLGEPCYAPLALGDGQALGHPALVQSAPMEIECQLLSHGIAADQKADMSDHKIATLSAGAKDWQLLLQLDTDPIADFGWGEGGRLDFWIRGQDLSTQRFDRCWVILQSH